MAEVLSALLAGERLTVQRAFQLFHTTELRKIISRLRRKGYNIKANKLTHLSLDNRKVHYNEYYLDDDTDA
jgi:protein associated with RNAse G/E